MTHDPKGFDVLEHFKKGAPKVLTFHRKCKFQRDTTEEFIQGIYEFKVFTRNIILFLSPASLVSRK